MKKLPVVIGIATCYAAFYQIAPVVGVPAGVVVVLFGLAHFIVIYMAYVILKYGIPTGDTFEDKFYEDSDYRRNRCKSLPGDNGRSNLPLVGFLGS